MGTKMVSLRLEEGLLAWADAYAEGRGVSRSELLEQAVLSYKDDCDRGVPEFRERLRRQQAVKTPKDGECSCPVLPNGRRGFKVKCPVHGGRTREDFARLTRERAELFSQLRTPDSVRGLAKPGQPPKDAA